MRQSTKICFITTTRGFHAVLPCRAAVGAQDPHLRVRDHPTAPGLDRVAVAEAHPRQQALLVLAYLRKGETFAELASTPLPGSVHDKKAEWIWAVLAELEAAGLVTLADKGNQGSTYAKIPYKGKNKPDSQKQANKADAKLRVLQPREA
jgi:hypothetical protein